MGVWAPKCAERWGKEGWSLCELGVRGPGRCAGESEHVGKVSCCLLSSETVECDAQAEYDQHCWQNACCAKGVYSIRS